jgi:hypothetical protein
VTVAFGIFYLDDGVGNFFSHCSGAAGFGQPGNMNKGHFDEFARVIFNSEDE